MSEDKGKVRRIAATTFSVIGMACGLAAVWTSSSCALSEKWAYTAAIFGTASVTNYVVWSWVRDFG